MVVCALLDVAITNGCIASLLLAIKCLLPVSDVITEPLLAAFDLFLCKSTTYCSMILFREASLEVQAVNEYLPLS